MVFHELMERETGWNGGKLTRTGGHGKHADAKHVLRACQSHRKAQTRGVKKPVSLQQIADEAGVSKGTVSLALRNHPRIPEATRKRISEVADKMGYRPNPVVSAWMSHRRQLAPAAKGSCIAFINLWPDRKAWDAAPWFTRFTAGARERAEYLGYSFEEFRLHDPGMSEKRITSILRARGIRGMIVGSLPEGSANPDLAWSDFAAVAQSNSLSSPELSRSVCDYAHGMRTALENLTSLGYRRIGYASPPTVEERTDFLNIGAYLAFQESLPKSRRIPVLDWLQNDRESLGKWILRYKPDAILSHDLEMGDMLGGLGLKVPDDIAVAALCLHPGQDRQIAGYDQKLEHCGEVAVELLVERMNRNEAGPPEYPVIALTRGTWHHGKTV